MIFLLTALILATPSTTEIKTTGTVYACLDATCFTVAGEDFAIVEPLIRHPGEQLDVILTFENFTLTDVKVLGTTK